MANMKDSKFLLGVMDSPDLYQGRLFRCCHKLNSNNWGKFNRFTLLMLLVLSLIGMVLFTPAAGAEELHMSFLNPQGVIAGEQMRHWWLVVSILLIFVALPVFIALVVILARYHYPSAKKANRKYSPHWNFFRLFEFINWGGPLVIVIILATIVWQTTDRLDPYKTIASAEAPTKVQVIGYDWKWLFIYPELGIASVGTLAFPADRPVSMELTTAGNMQSLWVPALGSQIYAMAGMITKLNYEAYNPGRFLGMNTMYNGNGFHEQKFEAQAMTTENFDAWVQQAREHGQPLDAKAVQALEQRADLATLRKALPDAVAENGSVYFSNVSQDFFHDVVLMMMDTGVVSPDKLQSLEAETENPALISLASCMPGSICTSGD